ncbi:MAG: hypothetical protein IJV35_06345 [Neisseriaceae bacterium]|nr:hypothetical protein [Neisseriaceae bacterium]
MSLQDDRQLLMALPFTTVSPRAVRRGGLVEKNRGNPVKTAGFNKRR